MTGPPGPAASATVAPSCIVLLIDDQPFIAEAVRRLLRDDPTIAYHYCGNPLEAAEMAVRLAPTVILLDLVMPDVDGLVVLERMRAHPATANTPIVMLSSNEDAGTKRDAFALGASDYLVKLPDRVELVARVQHHSQSYLSRVERDAAFRALDESRAELLALNAKLERLTNVDGLTGLSNRRYLDERAGHEWSRAARHQTTMSALMIDVDHFKLFNDTRGHLAGDDVLKLVATTVRESATRPGDLAARFGGEEFIVLLPTTTVAGARHVGERIRARIEALHIAHGAPGAGSHVTVSVGCAATVPVHEESALVLIESADRALYEAKSAGRNRVVAPDHEPATDGGPASRADASRPTAAAASGDV